MYISSAKAMADNDEFESAPSTPSSPTPVEVAPPVVPSTSSAPEPTPAPDSPDIKPDPVPPEKSPSPDKAAADDWGWGGWSSWAASSVSNVAGMASNATKGISGALETFEASLGLPTPEELAKEMRESELKEGEDNKAEAEVKTKQGIVYVIIDIILIFKYGSQSKSSNLNPQF